MSTLLKRARICLWAAVHYEHFRERIVLFSFDTYAFADNVFLRFTLFHCDWWSRVGYHEARDRQKQGDIYAAIHQDDDCPFYDEYPLQDDFPFYDED